LGKYVKVQKKGAVEREDEGKVLWRREWKEMWTDYRGGQQRKIAGRNEKGKQKRNK